MTMPPVFAFNSPIVDGGKGSLSRKEMPGVFTSLAAGPLTFLLSGDEDGLIRRCYQMELTLGIGLAENCI
jgi:hypothetical protein